MQNRAIARMAFTQKVAAAFAVVLGLATLSNYVPGLTDEEGRVGGIFALDLADDLLHLGSTLWAAWAATGAGRARFFLRTFGSLYLLDGVLGLLFGAGYLDLGLLRFGIVEQDLGFRILANLPHVGLGGLGVAIGFWPGNTR